MRLLDYNDLSAATGISVATLRVWNQRGKLPAPAKEGRPVWLESAELRRWIKENSGLRADQS